NFLRNCKPRVVSVGPIHHGKPKYRLTEEYKLTLANDFIGKSGKSHEELYEIIKKNIKELRECFDEEVIQEYNDEALAWMLFVDGCATLQFIHSAVHDEVKNFKIKRDQVAFVKQDWQEQKLRDLIQEFIHKESMIKKIEKTENQPIHLLDQLRSRLLDCTPPSHDANKKGHTDFNSFRNVQELRAVGIYLMSRSSNCLRNISFTQTNWNLLACLEKIISFTKKELHLFGGTLRLPPITVNGSTGPKFFNLIAYEMCPDFDNDYGVTSYISFLDSLIDEAKDVKNIRRAGILHNLLGSDEEVAQFFNEIGTDLVPNPDIYGKVRSQIEVYYNKKRMTWIAEFLHTRFSSPWTIGAFVAALFALILSFIRALYG
ncbi:hypothetical protein ACB092_09G172300, partial [Castanea dentata]